jgi:hypothetical protein
MWDRRPFGPRELIGDEFAVVHFAGPTPKSSTTEARTSGLVGE